MKSTATQANEVQALIALTRAVGGVALGQHPASQVHQAIARYRQQITLTAAAEIYLTHLATLLTGPTPDKLHHLQQAGTTYLETDVEGDHQPRVSLAFALARLLNQLEDPMGAILIQLQAITYLYQDKTAQGQQMLNVALNNCATYLAQLPPEEQDEFHQFIAQLKQASSKE